MYVWTSRLLVLVLISGNIVRSQSIVDSARNIKDSLVDIAKNGVKDNPFLNKFLDEHSRPKVTWDDPQFHMNVDSRYQFKPPIQKAPFSSTGEPWPLPKHYKSEKESVLKINKATFKMSVLNHSCDILSEAINRYNKIIQNHTIEEHYDFLYNFNEKTFDDNEKREAAKYKYVAPMLNLEVRVIEEDCGYPHVEMNESYKLILRSTESRLTANQVWGALRGLETFSQLLFRKRNTDEVYAKVTEIDDEPRFPHRGIMLDTSRHYISKYAIKNVLDGMAYNKMNVLHWHLVDDNSFPYKSEVFPKLSEKGAFHPTLVYSIKDIKELVQYARYRGIRVVPEFDSPGHTFSWFGYPEIKSTCYVGSQPVNGPMGPINPAQDETYTFMAKLFGEIYDVFPDNFVHLGGDELHSTCWATNPTITAYLQEHGNIPASEAKSNAANYINKAIGYYFKRLIETLKTTAKEKQLTKSFIMWVDVLKNTKEVPTDSILQVWMGRPADVQSLNQRGYRALFSSCWYLDNYKTPPMWPDYYKCEPSPYRSEAEEKGKLLGGDACLWAESITTDTLMTFMWPRASAPAERLWSPRTTTDMASAQSRIQEQRCRMIYRGLPTGHISGPDYCLRHKDGPLGGNDEETGQNKIDGEQEARFDAQYAVEKMKDSRHISVFVLSQYHHYLPVVNIVLSLFGVYLIIVASRCWRNKFRMLSVCQKST